MSATPEWESKNKLKAYKVSEPDHLLEVYHRYSGLAETLIHQEWVVGPETNLYSCNCYYDSSSVPQTTFVARKLRQWPPITGERSLGEECRDDTVLEIILGLFSAVNYYGLGYVEIKRDARNDKYYIMEPNVCRPTGRSAISEAGGVELVYTMYCDALGWPLPPNQTQTYGSAKWIYLRRDMQSAIFHWRNGSLTFTDWIRSLSGKKRFALFSWSDPGPFLGDLTRSIKLFLSKEEREKRNYQDLS